MSAPERFSRELDSLLSDICFSGLKNIHPSCLEKMSRMAGTARELGMEQGARLLEAFAFALRDYRLAREAGQVSESESPAALLGKLDFYNKTVMGNMEHEYEQ